MIILVDRVKLWVVISLLTVAVTGFWAIEKLATARVFKPIYYGNGSRKWVAVTVNVDWGEEYLDEMLNFFAASQIKATFFITGRWCQANPELVKKICSGGHEIGNHGFYHEHVNNLSLEDNKREIELTDRALTSITKKKPRYYAPPYGEFNDTVLRAAHETGHQTILWSVDTVDWMNPSPEEVSSRVMAKVHNGAIILMHPTLSSTRALPEIIRRLKEQGYQIVSLEKLIAG